MANRIKGITVEIGGDTTKLSKALEGVNEDIIDTGRTLNDVKKMLLARNPLSLKIITLLDKPDRRLVGLKADLSLFTIPDLFVIGYGLDCGELYRNLPYIAEYDEEGQAE